MDFQNINIDKIIINKSIKNSYDIIYDTKHLEIFTPKLFIPFGLRKKNIMIIF